MKPRHLVPGALPLPSSWPTLAALVVATLTTVVTSTYLSDKKYGGHQRQSNIIDRHQSFGKSPGSLFKYDKDILRYLRIFGKDAMIWRCKNAIQPYWNWKPLPVVELYCEAIGSLEDVSWYHNGKPLKLGHRYKMAMYPHHHQGRYFSNWIDFRLRIYNATHRDSGVFTFEMIGRQGSRNRQNIYVDISEKRRRHKERLWRESHRRSHRKDDRAKHHGRA